MKKHKNLQARICSLIMTLAMVCSILPTNAMAASGDQAILVDGNNGYTLDAAGLQKAFDDATDSKKIKLGGDIALGTTTVTVKNTYSTKTITLDLNGKTITYTGGENQNNAILLDNNSIASLTIMDGSAEKSGTLKIIGPNTSENTSNAIKNHAGKGNITIAGGNIVTINGYPIVSIGTSVGDIIVTDGTLQSSSYACAIYSQGAANITISGGTVGTKAGKGPAIKVSDSKTGDITISGDAKILSSSGDGTIAIGKTPSPARKFLIINGGAVTNGDSNKYAVKFPATLTAENVSNYYSIAEGATVGKIYPEALPDYTGTQAGSPSETPVSKTTTQIVLAAVTVADETVEYAKSSTNIAPTSDSAWQTSTTFDGLTANTQYYFFARVKETTTHKAGTISAGAAIKTAGGSTGGGGSSSSSSSSSVTIDGKTESIGKIENTGTTTTVVVDSSKLNDKISTAKDGSSVVVPISTTKDSAVAQLKIDSIEKMAAKDMMLEVKSGKTTYNLPTSAIDTKGIIAKLDATDATKVLFDIDITSKNKVTIEGATIVATPMSFTVNASYNGKNLTIDSFDTMVARTIEITKDQAAKVATAVVVETNGDLRHVPTYVYEKNGKWYAEINSMTNSTYALIENKSVFTDVSGKWYETAANELSARKVTNHVFDATFMGEKAITRAEFAALLVNAFGLPKDGKANFTDVAADAWYSQAVATANEYGIVNGLGNGKFDPNATITRQEAMVMIQRAASVVGYDGGGFNTVIFTDRGQVAQWATAGVNFNLANNLIIGSDGKINPTSTITRAETATVLLRLLQKAQLVDLRATV